MSSIPRATARLQFHKDFTFDDAVDVVDYYAKLGISHLYASPILTARSGSTHGYDIVDPTNINPELGGEAGLRRLVARLREAGMGLIIDIVPNHMGVGPENPWWQHMLEWGPESPYAAWFDIDWKSPDNALCGKVLAPFLGQPYGEVLSAGDIKLQFDESNGKIFAGYYTHRFPITPASYADVLRTAGLERLEPVIAAFETIDRGELQKEKQSSADIAFSLLRDIGHTADGAADIDAALMSFSAAMPHGLEALHQLLERQHYRLTWWRNAAEEINWRRFFEVSDLAGLRVEQDDVFEAAHAVIFRLYTEGLIDGVRVDHVDGLSNPGAYCRKLRERLTELTSQRPFILSNTRPYIIIEKILEANEQLRADWGVDGTTGYEFMDQVGALLHDPAGATPLTELWRELTGDSTDFETEVRSARRQLLAQNFVGEFDAAARALHAIARADFRTRDVSLASIRRVLTELLVYFPVYRTYAGADGRDQVDQKVFDEAAKKARLSLRSADRWLIDVVGGWLGGEPPCTRGRSDVGDLCLRAITRFQQLTPPLAAKSVEDTAFYRYGRLLSRNEVGANPGQFFLGGEDFHKANTERARRFPNTLLATATHDHKRGEDVRTRLAVLSEMPQQWGQAVRSWMTLNAPLHIEIAGEYDAPPLRAPSAADELMLYQMLVGAWPLDLVETDCDGVHAFAERVDQWQTKALREAKRASNWAQPNEQYEAACRNFLLAILDAKPDNAFLKELAAWVRKIAPAGAANSLTQTLLRMTSPGVPDLYQGTDFWDFSLVDPDNRRPVDFVARKQALSGSGSAIASVDNWQDGRLKLEIIHRTLALRAQDPELFARGEYVPLAVEGALSGNVIAFMRRFQDRASITIATRFPAHIIAPDDRPTVLNAIWKDTVVILPEECQTRWMDAFTGNPVDSQAGRLRMTDVLGILPIALLHAET